MGGSSKSSQKAEGDVVFNNVDYGGQGSSSGSLKNFNVGRENTLSDNIFNITDGGATRNALAAGVAMNRDSNATVQKGTAFALGSNEAIAKAGLGSNEAVSKSALQSGAFIADTAINAVSKTSSEAIKSSAALAKDTTRKTFDYADNTNRRVIDFANDSTEGAYDLSRDTLGTYENLVSRTGQQVTDAQVTSADASGLALDYVFQSSKSATERQSETLIKYATYGGIAIVGAVALTAMARANG